MIRYNEWVIAVLSCALVAVTVTSGRKQQSSSEPLIVGAIFDKNDQAASTAFDIAVAAANVASGPRLVPRAFMIPRNDIGMANASVCALLSEGAVAIVTDAGARVSEFIEDVANTREIPQLTLSTSMRPMNFFTINLRPSFKAVMKATISDAAVPSSSRVAFVTTGPDVTAKRRIISDLDNKIFFKQWQASTKSALLDSMKASEVRSFLVDLPAADARKFLLLAKEKQMDSADYYFCFIMTNFDWSPSAITGFARLAASIRAKVQIQSLVPMNLPARWESLRRIIDKATIERVPLIPTNAALIYDGVLLLSKALGELSRAVHISRPRLSCSRPDSRMEQGTPLFNYMLIGMSSDANRDTITGPLLFDASTHQRTQFRSRLENVVAPSEAPRVITKRAAVSNPMKGKTLRVVVVPMAPFVEVRKDEVNNNVFIGHDIDLLKRLAEDLGFNYTIRVTADKRYGSRKSDGRWTGMIGELMSGTADLAVAPLTMTYERGRVVDFLFSYMEVGLKILVYNPEVVKVSPAAFFMPLTPTVWIVLLIAYVIVSFVIFIVAKLNPFEWHRAHHGADVRVNDFSLLNSFWFAIGGCLRQYPGLAPRSTSVRIIAGFWWVVVLIFFVYYLCKLYPLVTETKPQPQFTSFNDIVAQDKVKFGCFRGGSTYRFFSTATSSRFATMFERMSQTPGNFKDSYSAGIRGVLKGRGSYAFIGESSVLERSERQNCRLKVLPQSVNNKGYAFAVPKNSPYLSGLNLAMLKAKNNYLDSLNMKYFSQRTSCEESMPAKSFSMNETKFIFVLLLIGLVLGIVCGIVECVCNRCCGKGRQSNETPLSECRSSLTTTKRAIA